MSAGRHRKSEGISRLWKRSKSTPVHLQIRQRESVSVDIGSSETIPSLNPTRTAEGVGAPLVMIPVAVWPSEQGEVTERDHTQSVAATDPVTAARVSSGRSMGSLAGFATRALTAMASVQFLTPTINEDTEIHDGVHH